MSNLLLRRRNLLIKEQENIRAVCFKADGEQTVAITKVGSAPAITMQYSYDGVNWDAWDLSALPFGGSTKVYVRGVNNVRFSTYNARNTFTFGTDSYVYVSGVLESLLDGDNEVLTYTNSYALARLFSGQTALRSVENLRFEAQSSTAENVYSYMFYSCPNLLYAPKSLSIVSFSGGHECAYMFSTCGSLIKVPELPATTLSQYCYEYMFKGCTSLLTASEIIVKTTNKGSHKGMFINCTSLVNAPELPAINLGAGCYVQMFENCSSLVNAPELPATTLSQYCYEYMFKDCNSLKSIRCRAKVKTYNNETNHWFDGVSTSGTFYGYSEYGWSSGSSGIPSGWEFVELTD